MKFDQAFHLKDQLENTVEKLTMHVAGPNASDAVRIRLAVTHVSVKNLLSIAQADQQNRKIWLSWKHSWL